MVSEEDFMAGILGDLDATFNAQNILTTSSTAKPTFPPVVNTLIDLTDRPSSPSPSSREPSTPKKEKTKHTNEERANYDIDMDELFAGAEDWDLDDFVPSPTKPSPKKPSLPIPQPAKNDGPDPYTRCIVDLVSEVQRERRWFKQLDVHVDKALDDKRVVLLEHDWYETDVRPGDIINAIGAFSPAAFGTPTIIINAQENLLILHPDVLLTATALSNAPQCARKPLLSSLVRASNEVTPALVWGNMLHEVMQSCLSEKRWEEEWINQQIDLVLHNGLGMLLSLNVSVQTARTELRKRAVGLGIFKERYIADVPKPDAVLSNTRSKANDPDSLLAIQQLHEIEEDIWSPKYGLKGKIDATVEAVITDKAPTSALGKYLAPPQQLTSGPRPFEIKTGRSVAGLEHRAQTMLYTLLTSERYGVDVQDGLLYYTQSDTVVRVPRSRNELRGLVVARNELAGYMIKRLGRESEVARRRELEQAGDIEEIGMHSEPFLPPPIDNDHACKKCYTLDTCMLYRYAYSVPSDLPTLESAPSQVDSMYDTYDLKTGHLTTEQGLFFRKWETLLSLEERDLVRFRRELWTIGAEDREKKGRCFAGMIVRAASQVEDPTTADVSEGKGYKFCYTFTRSKASLRGQHGEEQNLLNGHMNVGDPVTLSVEPHLLAFAQGYITHLTTEEVTLGVDHRVDLEWIRARLGKGGAAEEVVFRIDKDELFGGMGRMRNNLAQLFYADGDKKRLELVVDLRKPRFTPSPSPPSSHHLSSLNSPQKAAVAKALSAEDYALILGMPGTGKTTVIAALIKMLVDQGKTVLLTSYTHSAVDTILRKLDEGGELDFGVLRLGNIDKIHPDVRKYTLGARKKAETVEQLETQWMRPPVVAATCLSVDHPLFNRRSFDYCIVDEASQITLPTCLGPLRFANTFVLVGDHFQLPPLVKNPFARRGGLDVSLFRRLSDAHPESVVDLNEQYRMNEDIMSLSNKLIYEDRLRCGSDAVAKRKLVLPRASTESRKEDWLRTCHRVQRRLARGPSRGNEFCEGRMEKEVKHCWLSYLTSPDTTAVFVDTDTLGHAVAFDSRVGDLVQNEVEAELVVQLAQALVVKWGVSKRDVGVISLYRQQVKLIRSMLEERGLGKVMDQDGEEGADGGEEVEVLTADKSQGRDKECIIVSMVRSNDEGKVGDLVKDWRRMNVSFTRARSKLVIFGSRKTLSADPLLAQFFKHMAGRGWVYELPKDAHLVHKEDLCSSTEPLNESDDNDDELEASHGITQDDQELTLRTDVDLEMEEMEATLVDEPPIPPEPNKHGKRKVQDDDDVELVDGFDAKPTTSNASTSQREGKRKGEKLVIEIEEDDEVEIVGESCRSRSGTRKGWSKDIVKKGATSSKTTSSSAASSSPSPWHATSSNALASKSESSLLSSKGKGKKLKENKVPSGVRTLDSFFSVKPAAKEGQDKQEDRPSKRQKANPVEQGAKPISTAKAMGLLKGRVILHDLVANEM